ncbi:SDR family NAD(P)-dependent oxidoreductase [Micromonospora sp. KC207]|nr:SDR family NAD(P)-dependent oxidoreductase [Micromonospora sp. KC207]
MTLSPGTGLAAAPPPADGGSPGRCEAPDFADHVPGWQEAGDYALPSVTGLLALAEELGCRAAPPTVLAALAWGSWFAGMRRPGRDCLLSGLRLRPGASRTGYQARVRGADPRTGALVTDAELPGLTLELRAFQRLPVAAPTWASATAYRPADDALAGERALVVGGSRGLGAAVTAALAARSATVWAGQRDGATEVAALADEFGGRVRALRLDAADADQSTLRAAELDLTGLVLCAGPAVRPVRLHPDTVPAVRDFVDRSLAMVLNPLTAVLDRIRPGGWLVVVSSSAVEDFPAHWPHYAAAKAAVEALGEHCARVHGLRVLVVRPPRLRTDMAAGPLGVADAVDPGLVAARIAGWVPGADLGVTIMGSAELTQSPAATA